MSWESKYDPMDVARWKEDARMTVFGRDVIKALRSTTVIDAVVALLRDPRVLAALPEILREAHAQECRRVAGEGDAE